MTDDFEAAVLTGKDDHGQIPAKLRAKQSPEWDEIAPGRDRDAPYRA